MTERFQESLTEAIREGESGQPVFVVIRRVGDSVIGVTLTSEMADAGYAYQTHVGTKNLSGDIIDRYKELFSPATFSRCDNINGPALCAVHILPDEVDALSPDGSKKEIFRALRGFAEEHAQILEDLRQGRTGPVLIASRS
ncbi:hypothetical protein HY405_01340 [Candidatus Microgenomates bacterium]|nr:hypothetical protein [Candidatus Microgenomates bacterium]